MRTGSDSNPTRATQSSRASCGERALERAVDRRLERAPRAFDGLVAVHLGGVRGGRALDGPATAVARAPARSCPTALSARSVHRAPSHAHRRSESGDRSRSAAAAAVARESRVRLAVTLRRSAGDSSRGAISPAGRSTASRVEHPDPRRTAARDVEEALLAVRGERDARGRLAVAAALACREAPAVDPRLREIAAFDREHLHALAAAVGRVDETVVRHLDAVDRAELRRPGIVRIEPSRACGSPRACGATRRAARCRTRPTCACRRRCPRRTR